VFVLIKSDLPGPKSESKSILGAQIHLLCTDFERNGGSIEW
jgi:hypothetical protein